MYELTSSNQKKESGGNEHEGEKIPLVSTYKTVAFQSAFLKRAK